MRRGVLVLIAGLTLMLGACGEDPNDAAAPPGAVDIADSTFQPSELKVAVGDTVTWTNSDDFAHTVTADDGSFDSGNLDGGTTFEQTFDAAGTFAYSCKIHTFMKATVVVT